MKQLLYLLLFPCLALAQYQGNANQKITLGEQTTTDGLVWRGRTTDTVNLMTSKLDTSAYLVLDTITEAIWLYRASTTPKWNRVVDSLNNLQGQLSLTTKVTGVLPLGNGGTGSTTQNFVDLTTTQSIGGDKTFTSAVVGARFNPTSSTASGNGMFLPTTNTLAFSTAGVNRLQINPNGRVGIGTTTLTGILNIKGVGSELSIQTDANNVYFEGINRENTALSVDYGFYARNGNHRFWTGIYTERMTILNNGNVGIGTASPAVQFHTTGGVRFATFAGGGTTTLSVDNNGDLARTSSFELKKDVIPINYGLNEILQINPINFNWIDGDKFGNENENGFIAEDVMSIIPNVVGSDAHGLFMDYTKLIPILTKAIQEQQALIKALEQRLLILENK